MMETLATTTPSSARPLLNRLLDKFLCQTYGHAVSVQLLAIASISLLLSSLLYFLSPILDDDYHIYQQYLPWVYYLDWGQYNSFIVDHIVVFLTISLPIGWLFLWNVAYSSIATRMDVALLVLRIASCVTVSFSLTVILAEFLSRRVMLAIISLAYGAMGLLYSWSVPVWRWYLDEARTKGFIAFMPAYVQQLLLRTSLLEWLTDTTFTQKIRPYLPFLLPLSKAEQSRLLEQLPVESQIMMTRPGLMPFLPTSIQRVLLPSDDSNVSSGSMVVASSHQDGNNKEESDKQITVSSTASAGFDFHNKESSVVSSANGDEVVADIITQRIWSGCKDLVKAPSPKTLNRTASVSTALLVLQMYASRRSRQMIVAAMQLIVTSALGSVACCAILLRMLQLMDVNLSTCSVPMLRYAHRFLLRNQTAPAQLDTRSANDNHVKSQVTLRKAATSASAVVAILYVLRKMRG